MAYEKTVWQDNSSGPAVYVRFLDRTDFSLAKYHKISMEGFSCFCNQPLQAGEITKVEVNLKMLTRGSIDDTHPHVATAKVIGFDEIDGKQVIKFRYIDFGDDCFDNLVIALSFLDSKEKVTAIPVTPTAGKDGFLKLDKLMNDIIDKARKGQIALPVLPKIVQEIERLFRRPDTTIEDLAKVIERDAVVAVKVLATANSPFYRTDSQIKTIRETIPRLGFKETRNLVLTIANKSLYQVKNKLFREYFDKLWKHSLTSAQCAKAIAEVKGYKNSELFYTAGLFHDIGKTVLFRFLGDVFQEKVPFSKSEIIEAAEKHSRTMGHTVLKHWELPEKFVNAITMPHTDNIKDGANKISLAIDAASVLSCNMGFDLTEEKIELNDVNSVRLLDIKRQTFEMLMNEVSGLMENSGNLF